jgi:hypothetical protein
VLDEEVPCNLQLNRLVLLVQHTPLLVQHTPLLVQHTSLLLFSTTKSFPAL